ncbi:MAG: hypothetical protein JJU11_14360 [Candidatus Sumerlaeia bacterium]|nr:hypothetical protein [Candidatus Sumerlaeia bacterium]
MTLLSWGGSFTNVMEFVPPDHSLMPLLVVLSIVGSTLGCFAYIYLIILAILSVVSFAPNVYKMTFGEEEGLQSAPLSFEERIAAIIVPYLRGIVIVLTPYFVGALLLMAASALFVLFGIPTETVQQRMEVFFTAIFMVIFSMLSVVYYPPLILIMAMMVIRRLLQHRQCGAMPNTGFFFVAGPFILYMIIWVLVSGLTCCGIPLSFMLIGEGAGVGFGMILIFLVGLMMFLLPPVISWYMLADWLNADLVNARKYLFQPEE